MCTKFLGDGLCCGYDCYEWDVALEMPVDADFDAFEKFCFEADDALAVDKQAEESDISSICCLYDPTPLEGAPWQARDA